MSEVLVGPCRGRGVNSESDRDYRLAGWAKCFYRSAKCFYCSSREIREEEEEAVKKMRRVMIQHKGLERDLLETVRLATLKVTREKRLGLSPSRLLDQFLLPHPLRIWPLLWVQHHGHFKLYACSE
ncbi:uncharacterized protein A4U43_C04F15150 [Asparagus officinalis]|uniref:Uncharacterized protein n=1 Tax=Asparagus officinalis TaxID=4686 RepID=A0A5P1F108_ASPOF|nr:uncharacterized protein A4U43_C04F15150 [Asparagus officinalis]